MTGKDQRAMIHLDCLAATHIMNWPVQAVWPYKELKAPRDWKNLALRTGPKLQYVIKETLLPNAFGRGMVWQPTRDLPKAFRVAETCTNASWELHRRPNGWTARLGLKPMGSAHDSTAAVAIVKAALDTVQEQ